MTAYVFVPGLIFLVLDGLFGIACLVLVRAVLPQKEKQRRRRKEDLESVDSDISEAYGVCEDSRKSEDHQDSEVGEKSEKSEDTNRSAC